MSKKVEFAHTPRGRKADNPSADQWVKGTTGKMKRFTIDVPEELHRRIKLGCAQRGTKMADEIRVVLEKHFSVKA
jgi:ParG